MTLITVFLFNISFVLANSEAVPTDVVGVAPAAIGEREDTQKNLTLMEEQKVINDLTNSVDLGCLSLYMSDISEDEFRANCANWDPNKAGDYIEAIRKSTYIEGYTAAPASISLGEAPISDVYVYDVGLYADTTVKPDFGDVPATEGASAD